MNRYFSIIVLFLFAAGAVHAQSDKRDSLFLNKCISLAELENPERKMAILKEVKEYTQGGDEASLLKSATMLYYLGMPIESDSIYLATAKKYPKGEAAKTIAFSEIMKVENGGKKAEDVYRSWTRRFSNNKSDSGFHNDAMAHIAMLYAKEHDKVKTIKWLSACKDSMIVAKTAIDIAEMALNDHDTIWAGKMMESGIGSIRAMSLENDYKSAYFMKYASFLYNTGHADKALSEITAVYKTTQDKTVALKKLYASILLANNKSKEALYILAEMVKDGKADENLMAELKKAYLQVNGNAGGYDSFVSSLQEGMKSKIRKEMNLEMLSEKAPLFSLYGLDSKLVSMEGLKGKIVILDFWATWCGPCKRSFPSMKSAIGKYAADSNVVFLFIDCMERVAHPEDEIKKFLVKNQYPFKVLLDSESIVAGQYGVKGIPNKVIIDQNGIIRYRIVGFEDGDDAAVEKLSAMIEAVRKAG